MRVLTKEEFFELNKERLEPLYQQLEIQHEVDGEKEVDEILEHEYKMYLAQVKEIQRNLEVVQDDN